MLSIYPPIKMRRKKVVISVAFCLLISQVIFFNPLKAQHIEGVAVQIIDSLFSSYNSEESAGVAVVVVKAGKVIYNKGYGMANLELKVPITASTVFDLASVSKQFAAFSILLLEQQGKLSIEDDIRKHIPEMHDFGKTITIKHLLNHTSGIRDWASTFPLAGKNMLRITYPEILTYAFNQRELNFETGTEYSYTNTGYNLLTEIVQRVTKTGYRQWCDSVILKPLGMISTIVHDIPTEIIPHLASGYPKENGKYTTLNSSLTAMGSSSLFSSVDDMAKWMIEMDNPRPEWKQVFENMFVRGKLNNDSLISYGSGLSNTTFRGVKEINHSGAWGGYRSFYAYFPTQHLSVVVLQNQTDNSHKNAHDLAALFLTGLEPVATNPEPVFITLPASTLQKYTGKYRLTPGQYVTISQYDTLLRIQAVGEESQAFVPTSDTSFWAYGRPFVFYKDKSGHLEGFKYQNLTCPRITEKKTKLSDFLGTYTSEELKISYNITLQNDTLIATRCGDEKLKLIHAANDDFQGSWYAYSVEFYRNKKGRVEGFFVTVTRSRKQRFVKTDD